MNDQAISKLNEGSYTADMKIICEKINDKIWMQNHWRKTFQLVCCNHPNRHPENIIICKILLQTDACGIP